MDLILDNLIDIKDDGTFSLNLKYFNYCTGLTMTNRRFDRLFGARPRAPETELTHKEMDMAASIQVVTETVVLRLARTLHEETGEKYLCLAGGVALNCVANGRILGEGPFDRVWIQPAAGDAGGALGAGAIVWHQKENQTRKSNGKDQMQGAFLGPSFSETEIRQQLDQHNAVYRQMPDALLFSEVAEILEAENVVGWFQG